MIPAITSFYAALLALLFIFLSKRVITTRREERVSIGDGNNPRLCRAIAVHNNFAQYVPFALLLITFVELSAAPVWLVHLLGLLLLAGRVLHVYGVGREPENFRMRTWAMVLTFTVLAIAAVQLLATTLIRWIIAA
jgi:uncharacterized membrane protein YecN with MAPEG domain